jgi:hypothetical protein
MPELSRFYGIVIRMYSEPFAPHHRPHFHAYYQESVAIYTFEPVELIAGSFQPVNSAWLKPGQNCTRMSYDGIGNSYWAVADRNRLLRSNKFDRMKHPIHRVVGFSIVGPYTLEIEFDDRTGRKINFTPVLKGELFGELRDLTLFEKVELDPEVHTLVWPNGADFDPATLHDWPSDDVEVNTATYSRSQKRDANQ